MSEIKDFNFFKDTVQQFKSELQKMISGSSYSNSGVIELKAKIDKIEKNIQNQEKRLVKNYLKNTRKIKSSHLMQYEPSKLPQISQPASHIIPYTPEDLVYTSLKYQKQSSLDRLEISRRQREMNEEKLQYIQNMKNRRQKSDKQIANEMRRERFYDRKRNEQILAKYNINSKFYDNLKVTTPMPNYMNPEKRIQFSVISKKFNGNEILYDEYKQPIIKKEELEKGLLNMINKGLIPKGADLSPAFEANGHPMQLNKNFKEEFEKTSYPDDYDTAAYDVNKYNKNMEYEPDGFFITKQPNVNPMDFIEVSKPKTPLEKEIKKEESVKENIKEEEPKKEKEKENIPQPEPIKEKMLLFSNFKVIQNESYHLFYKTNQDKWGNILYIFNHLSKLFKKLNLHVVEVSQDKILNLASDETVNITNRDLLECVSPKDLSTNKLDPKKPIQFYATLKDKSALIIQMAFRMYLAKKKVSEMKGYTFKIMKLQNFFSTADLVKKAQIKAKGIFNKRKEEWKKMMGIFKKKWDLIKTRRRVEIHINSISLNSNNALEMNATFDKFNQKENLQLNRIMGLSDPNIEIIYVSPYNISSDILAYYFSMLSTLGINDAEQRFHLIVPDEQIFLKNGDIKIPPYFSVSQKLLLCPDILNRIKSIIKGKEAYIVPGRMGKFESLLSIQLNVPILMGDLDKTESISTKSGAKLVFLKNDIPTPISNLDLQVNIKTLNLDTESAIENEQNNVKVEDNIQIENSSKEESENKTNTMGDKTQRTVNEIKSNESNEIKYINNTQQWGFVSEDHFYEILSMLITKYYQVEIWVIKLDNEYAARGIAYIQLEKLPKYSELKATMKNFEKASEYKKEVKKILVQYLKDRIKIYSKMLYKTWYSFLDALLAYGGIIEACPVPSPSKVLSSPCIPFLIEPDGKIEFLPTYDKSNLFYFKCIGATSPSKLFLGKQNVELQNKIKSAAEKLAKYLYEKDIIGYVTLELILTRSDVGYNTILFNAIDIKFGLTDISSSINFCLTLYNSSIEMLADRENLDGSLSINNNSMELITKNLCKCQMFTFPFFTHDRIKKLKMFDLVKSFRNENLIYDIEKKKGVLFNFSDVLQCGCMGLCGIFNEDKDVNSVNIEMWDMIRACFAIMSVAVKLNNDFQSSVDTDARSDFVEFVEIYSKINRDSRHIIKGAEKIGI
ncbi:MAG: hypothetical protein MJ252_09870 [archaeon]|nr:hypothetical protein [archaeon]